HYSIRRTPFHGRSESLDSEGRLHRFLVQEPLESLIVHVQPLQFLHELPLPPQFVVIFELLIDALLHLDEVASTLERANHAVGVFLSRDDDENGAYGRIQLSSLQPRIQILHQNLHRTLYGLLEERQEVIHLGDMLAFFISENRRNQLPGL
ncbi:hypothetical protein PENTCL1PPCAC_23828, partial [Pristionchus entomophagus]